MSPMTHKLNLAAIWAAIVMVIAGFGGFANWVLDKDKDATMVAVSTAANTQTIARLATQVQSVVVTQKVILRKLRVRHAAVDTLEAVPPPAQPPGIVWRVLGALFRRG